MHFHFCTYFDHNYLCQGLTLYRSLKRQKIEFTLYVACLDDDVFATLDRLRPHCPELVPIRLADIEAFDPDFLAVKSGRSRIEYYFTLSPVLPLYILAHFPEIDVLGYLDADLYFYASPRPIYDELGNESLLVIEHRFPPEIKFREKFGRFNVQCQLYRNDIFALSCLRDWRTRCLEWCFDRLDGDRFADQKYLDHWPENFSHLVILQNPAAGLAPWNWYNYRLAFSADKTLTVNGQPLIFYHFQGFKRLNRWVLNHGLGHYGRVMPRWLLCWFYRGYLHELDETFRWLTAELGLPNISLPWRNSRTGFGKLRAMLSGLRHHCLMWSGKF